MMIYDEKKIALEEKILPWLYLPSIDADLVLRPDAPEEVKQAKKELDIYNEKYKDLLSRFR